MNPEELADRFINHRQQVLSLIGSLSPLQAAALAIAVHEALGEMESTSPGWWPRTFRKDLACRAEEEALGIP